MTEILNNPACAESYESLTFSEVVDTARIEQVTIVVPTRNERDNVQPLLWPLSSYHIRHRLFRSSLCSL